MLLIFNIILICLVTFFAYKYLDLRERLVDPSSGEKSYLQGVAKLIDSVECYDSEHGLQMARMAQIVAERMNLDEHSVSNLKIAAYLHDAGELQLPQAFFQSKKPLTREEWFLIKTHPLLGELAFRSTVPGGEEVPAIIRWHHERWDGTGYPDRLMGTEIPLLSRILAVVDAISAMYHDRPYRKAMTHKEIRSQISSLSGLQFDPAVVEAILSSEIISGKNSETGICQ